MRSPALDRRASLRTAARGVAAPQRSSSAIVRALSFGTSILTGAFLLFQVQPIVAKSVLPWFGGSPAVWTTCMLFFQAVLFGGYLYAHLVTQFLPLRAQAATHMALIALALLALPITPADSWKPIAGDPPTVRILALLSASAGFPFFALSTTGPLMQAWFSRVSGGRSPYRFFALSNLGSLLALFSYPFAVEPIMGLGAQGAWWSAMFLVYAASCTSCAIQLWQLDGEPAAGRGHGASWRSVRMGRSRRDWLPWLLLPALASALLLAVTNHLSQNLTVAPFLWVLPLGLYLATFVLCFEGRRWYSRTLCALGALVACVVTDFGNQAWFTESYVAELVINLALLFFVCMLCHGELARRKPDPQYLTWFYLMVSAGGALGGAFVAVACPLLFAAYVELNLSILLGFVLGLGVLVAVARRGTPTSRLATLRDGVAIVMALALIATPPFVLESGIVEAARSFHGVVTVTDRGDANAETSRRTISHGQIVHGMQFQAAGKRREPTTYYGRPSGLGLTLDWFARAHDRPIRVGVAGLGAGTVAAYGRLGDYYRFYEINPAVVRLAKRHFSFLADSRAQIDVVLGDARLTMERESPQAFDVLVLDAFSGGAVPTHLLTEEAFELYRRHLQPQGVIVAHVSNQHVDLARVVRGWADHRGWHWRHVAASGDPQRGTLASRWVLVTENRSFLRDQGALAEAVRSTMVGDAVLWTDRYGSLFEVLS